VSLHLGIDYAVRVGFFSYVVFVAYVAFLPPDTVESWMTSLRGWWTRRRERRGPVLGRAVRPMRGEKRE
jgi:hypothetical protein